MANKHDLMIALIKHRGHMHAISSKAMGVRLGVGDRRVRSLVTECREDGLAICGHPTSGYFLATSPDELQETLDFLKHRALTSLKLASTLGNIPLGDLIGQLHINA